MITQYGGAIRSTTGEVRLRRCTFEDNAAESGGALFLDSNDIVIRDSDFTRNRAVTGGGAYLFYGSGSLIGGQFIDNESMAYGSALALSATVRVYGVRFVGNRAGQGGTVACPENCAGAQIIANSLFVGNNATPGTHGVLYASPETSALFLNVTAYGNGDMPGSILFATPSQDSSVYNSILWNNTAPVGTATITHSLVEGGFAGTGNIGADPRFVDAAGGDFGLASNSPAIDAGDNADVLTDSPDVDEDGDTAEAAPDLAGNPRHHDDANVVDTGAGTAPIVDMGAYERQIDSMPAGITVTPIIGLITTEAGGTADFTVVLDTQPSADVMIALSSSDTTEGTVAPASLTFTPANWNIAQTATVNGVDDAEVDGNVAYSIVTAAATSADANYAGINPSDVSVTNTDDDSAGITVVPTNGLTTTEAGGTASFTVVLNSQPSADVSIALSSSDTTEGTATPASLTFTVANWNIAQTVTVTGVDDAEVDGNVAYSIVTAAATSTDANYNGIDPSDVSVTNTDDDSAGIAIAPTSGLTTTEVGGTATFTVVLNSQPSADVNIVVSSNDTTEGAVSPSNLVFTTANWNVAQTVTATGVDDSEVDGDIGYTIVTAAAISTDVNYAGIDPDDVSVTNTDDDSAGITIASTSGLTTTEAGGTAMFTVMLNSQPSADVSIALSSSDTSEGTVAPASLTFTSANWNIAQTVTVSGVDDAEVDGNVAYSIVTAAATSADANYSGIDPANVSVTNTDNDVAGALVVAYKSVLQPGTTQQPVVYDIQLVNLGDGEQPDDPADDELVDVLPSELTLRTTTADGGTIILDLANNTVRWNGALAVGASPVTIRIEADVAITRSATIYNQAAIAYDANGDGSNDTSGLSSDPSQPGTDVPTAFEFAGGAVTPPNPAPIRVPVDNRLAQVFLALVLLVVALATLRRRMA